MNFLVPTKTFRIDVVGETTGESYTGEFTFKLFLTLAEKHDQELLYSRLLGDIEFPTQYLQMLSLIRSNMKYYLIDSPLWWKESENGGKLFDFNVLIELQKELNNAQSEYKEAQKKKAEEKN